ncbi:UDP-galactose 4-epimerase [Armatimonadetes bacterium GXS]|nr:UDP-glucose 4-epimerase [bacterium HR14]CUU34148.1 UDP-galactose 4-epimerase [Armatimonadetes bacterium GXS]
MQETAPESRKYPLMILVIGGAGYIGSHMVKYLLQRGESVVVLDNFSTGHRAAVRGATVVEGDLRDMETLQRVFAQYPIECVMHFAAFIFAGESMRHPAKYYDNNVLGCLRLLEAMRISGVSQIIFSSTAAVYGEPQQIPIPETHPLQPTNAYGETKRVMEGMLHWYGQAYGIRSIALRYFNAAGADPEGELGEDHRPEEHLIPLVLFAGMGKRPNVSVFGTDYDTPDGTCIRDYIHVWDLCEAHYLALQRLRSGAPSTVYNLGNGQGYSVLEVIRTAEQVIGKPIPVVYAERRAGDPVRLVASAEKAQRELGWKPQYPDLATMIEHAYRWFLKHPEGYDS